MSDSKYGLFKGMNDFTYHFEHDEISNSGLKVIHQKTPSKYYYQFLDPDYKVQRRLEKQEVMNGKNGLKSHLRFGHAFHIMLLEPNHFDERVILWSGKSRNTKDGKEEYAQALERFEEGKCLLTEKELETARDMCSGVMALSTARDFINAKGMAESSFFWRDPVHDVDCKARMDFITEDGFIVDVKTAANADHESFKRDAFNFKYYMQAAYYMRAYQEVMDEPAKGFCFVVVEKDPPYDTAIYYATEEELMLGNYHLDKALEKYAKCLKAGSWHGYPDKFQPLGLPPWGMKQLDGD